MNIGERIKRNRNQKGMSLRELAEKVVLSASFISQIEQGKASPSIENLKKIANCLDVRVSYLIEDEDSKKNSDLMKKENRRYVESLDSNTKMALLTSSN
ncbi:MAG: helix-turn-helix domain-containing protein, partial [Fusobacteriaceae bacterium]